MRWRGDRALILALVVLAAATVAIVGALAETNPDATEWIEPGPAPPIVVVDDPGLFGNKSTMSRDHNLILFRRPGSSFARPELAPPRRRPVGPLVAGSEEPETASADLPTEYALRRNAPNPSRGVALIGFDLPAASRVRLELYDLQGRRVHTLVDGDLPAGRHSRTWNAREGGRDRLAPGVYFATIDARSTSDDTRFTKVEKMVLLE